MICQKCGKEFGEGAFCMNCGAPETVENSNKPNTESAPAIIEGKMKSCKSCGRMIAKNAKTCPNCGAKIKKPIYKRFWFILLIVILIGIIIAATRGEKNYNFDEPEQTVTVDTILQDFKDNATTAGEKYSDKVIAVTGKVRQVYDDHIALEAYDDDLWLYSVYAYMSDSSQLTEFKNGKSATIVGVCDKSGLFGDVTVRKCQINDKFALEPDYANAIKTDAATIVKSYKENQVSADKDYKYKTIKLTGEVTYVADKYIVIEPKGTDAWDWDSDVQVYFENDEDLAKATKGKTMTIVGECYGKADFYVVKICRAVVG